MIDDEVAELRKAGAAYKRARDRSEQIMAGPRDKLTEKVRAAYAKGMRKVDILRAIDHVWSRQWLDDTVRDITPPKPATRGPRKATNR